MRARFFLCGAQAHATPAWTLRARVSYSWVDGVVCWERVVCWNTSCAACTHSRSLALLFVRFDKAYLTAAQALVLDERAGLHFSYHMYGLGTGTLSVELSIGGGGWNETWALSGDQGPSWHSVVLDFSHLANQSVARLRFFCSSLFHPGICSNSTCLELAAYVCGGAVFVRRSSSALWRSAATQPNPILLWTKCGWRAHRPTLALQGTVLVSRFTLSCTYSFLLMLWNLAL